MIEFERVLQLVSAQLLASPAVQAIVDDRVRGGWTRDNYVANVEKPALLFALDGGASFYEGIMAIFSMEVHGVSALGPTESSRIYTAAYGALQAECMILPGIPYRGMAVEVDSVRNSWAERTTVWYATGRWRLTIAKI